MNPGTQEPNRPIQVLAALVVIAASLACADAGDAPPAGDTEAAAEVDSTRDADAGASPSAGVPSPGNAGSRRAASAPTSDTLVYAYQQTDSAWGACDSGNAGCATARLRYPVLASAPSAPGLASLEAAVDSMMLTQPFVDGPPAPGAEALIEEFLDEYRALATDMPDISFGYLLERDLEVAYNTPTLVTLAFRESSYTGGAHPNSFTVYRSFDPRTGSEVTLADLLAAGTLPALTGLAEAVFRTQKSLAPEADLEDAGYWFEGGVFRLGDSFLPSDTALTIHYNSYDIAPYAEGPTTLLIPMADVRPLLREGGPWTPGG